MLASGSLLPQSPLASQGAQAAKLTLNPSSITLDTGSDGIPGRLADEQSAAGDPRRRSPRPDVELSGSRSSTYDTATLASAAVDGNSTSEWRNSGAAKSGVS